MAKLRLMGRRRAAVGGAAGLAFAVVVAAVPGADAAVPGARQPRVTSTALVVQGCPDGFESSPLNDIDALVVDARPYQGKAISVRPSSPVPTRVVVRMYTEACTPIPLMLGRWSWTVYVPLHARWLVIEENIDHGIGPSPPAVVP